MAVEAENKNTPESNQPAETPEQAAASFFKALAYAHGAMEATLKDFCEALAGPRESPVYVVPSPRGRSSGKKQRSRPVQDVVEPVAKHLWPLHGRPSRKKISNKAALKLLNDELDRQFGKAKRDPTSLLRAIGRRER
jgi:hypothetical protein